MNQAMLSQVLQEVSAEIVTIQGWLDHPNDFSASYIEQLRHHQTILKDKFDSVLAQVKPFNN